MDQFEYLSVLVSIVLALGLGEMAVVWGQLVQHRKQVRFSWLHGFWSACMVFQFILFWWGFWNYRMLETWVFGELVLIVGQALTLVMCAVILTPTAVRGAMDLEQVYFDSARPFFLIGATLLLQVTATDLLVMELPLLHGENVVRLVGAVAIGSAGLVLNRRLHQMLPIVVIALLTAFQMNVILI